MTEAEWLASSDPAAMLRWLTHGEVTGGLWLRRPKPLASERKLRLWACAVCRHPGVWERMSRGTRNLVAAAERGVDDPEYDFDADDWEELCVIGWNQCGETMPKDAQAALLREVVGNPWRPVTIFPGGKGDRQLPWLVRNLAQAAYEERLPDGTLDPDRLAVLSDATEEAGCDSDGLLAHLRSPGPHVRGCWVLDLILGKE